MKEKLLEKVKELIENRMQTSFDAMEAAKNSANEEGKSSAGDKYETARAMGQLDREMNGRMYEQARQERLSLDKIDAETLFTKVAFGALVETTMGTFFVSIGAGIIELDAKKFMTISPQAPIGQLIMGKLPPKHSISVEKSIKSLLFLEKEQKNVKFTVNLPTNF